MICLVLPGPLDGARLPAATHGTGRPGPRFSATWPWSSGGHGQALGRNFSDRSGGEDLRRSSRLTMITYQTA